MDTCNLDFSCIAWSPKSNSLAVLLIALFHYSVWAFVNGSDNLMTDVSLLMLLKLNSVY